MAEMAQAQVQRLIDLVAWMSQRDTGRSVSYRDAAHHLGISEAALEADLQVLLDLTESYKPWLGSLSVAIEARGFILSSLGSFRRPLRLGRDEGLALILGLTSVRGGRELAARLGSTLGSTTDGEVERAWAIGPTPGEGVSQVLALARRARDEGRKLAILYCSSEQEPSRRVIQPHQVVQAGGRWYLVAWCEQAQGPRHFRAERVLEARLLGDTFVPRRELKRVRTGKDLLAADHLVTATVAFSPRVARWIRERYAGGEDRPDGRYVVRFPVADPRWLAREVLQYGAEAEVLAPEGLRLLVREMVDPSPMTL